MTKTIAAKEGPIIFHARSIASILAGTKTQTRRIMKPQPCGFHHSTGEPMVVKMRVGPGKAVPATIRFRSGDRLWVKETWTPDHAAFYPHFPIVYRADGIIFPADIEDGHMFSPEANRRFPFRWRSPLFMPRAASRLTLEVVSVKVERLQDISEADAIAEGCDGTYLTAEGFGRTNGIGLSVRAQYARNWESINGKKHPWASNPWVIAVAFKVIPSGRYCGLCLS